MQLISEARGCLVPETRAQKEWIAKFATGLTGLSPSSLYHYRISTSEGVSADYSFLTAPTSTEPLEFVVVGDTRTNHGDHEDVMAQILAQVGHPPMIVNTGDLVEDGGNTGEWWDFFDIEHEIVANGALHALPGNHDDSGNYANWDMLFTAPDAYGGNNHYYGYDYGNVHFTIIDTQDDFTPGAVNAVLVQTPFRTEPRREFGNGIAERAAACRLSP